MGRLEQAIEFATDAHCGQVDKAGEPYILHPLRVMLAMSTYDERVVAVLHDVVEDSVHVTHGDIERFFGEAVATAVSAITRRDGELYMDYVQRAAAHPVARKVKLADIADNMSPARARSLTDGLRTRYGKAADILVRAALEAEKQG